MIYQLPSGKIIYITTEQYLSMSDEELDALSSQGYGEYARSPWTGSAISHRKKKTQEDQEDLDSSIDYTEESDELCREKPILNEEGPEEFPDTDFDSDEDYLIQD